MQQKSNVPVDDDNDERDGRWRRAEIVAALVHLYYMADESFDPSAMPRQVLARLLGVKRTTMWRAINDARESLALAEEIRQRLKPYYKDRAQRRAMSAQKRKAAVKAANDRAKLRRQAAKREKQRVGQ